MRKENRKTGVATKAKSATTKKVDSKTAMIEKYILSCVDASGYNKSPKTKEQKLAFVMETFKKEYWDEYHKRYFRNDIKKAFSEWLRGLPTSFGVDFNYSDLLRIAIKWGYLTNKSSERQEDLFFEKWWSLITNEFFKMHNRYLGSKGMNGLLPKGFTKAIATNVKVEGLNKKTGRLLKGYVYKNGKPTKVKPKAKK